MLFRSLLLWFLELVKVQGVGAKMAQKILGFFSVEDLVKALIAADVKSFSQISGIGPKLASRIVTELCNSPKKLGIDTVFDVKKITDFEKISHHQIAAAAISALENLGYKKIDCLRVIDFFIEDNTKITLENLITSSLRRLGRG